MRLLLLLGGVQPINYQKIKGYGNENLDKQKICGVIIIKIWGQKIFPLNFSFA
jgi:hypothetical protein